MNLLKLEINYTKYHHNAVCKYENSHFGKLNGISSNAGKGINNNSGTSAPAGLPSSDFLRRDGEPPLFIKFDAHIVFGEKVVSLKPVLLH